ncbi:unnamed protein product [Moneuplotes crassus]|uniref:Uncharacterized protein n=1 Tax=Euplotes crassus TaxID=5936 RepID=A0AAD1ULN3_EUPCR|nr:unnamed protein product [Moneuplotes crassus]
MLDIGFWINDREDKANLIEEKIENLISQEKATLEESKEMDFQRAKIIAYEIGRSETSRQNIENDQYEYYQDYYFGILWSQELNKKYLKKMRGLKPFDIEIVRNINLVALL